MLNCSNLILQKEKEKLKSISKSSGKKIETVIKVEKYRNIKLIDCLMTEN